MILDLAHIEQPFSGEYEERIFDNAGCHNSADWTWIKFEEEYSAWCGEFRGRYRGAVLSDVSGIAAILTVDCLYILDRDAQEVTDCRQQPAWREITCTPHGDILVSDGYGLEILIIDSKKIVDSKAIVLPVNADGLTFVGYDDDYLVLQCDEFCNWSNRITLLLDCRTMDVTIRSCTQDNTGRLPDSESDNYTETDLKAPSAKAEETPHNAMKIKSDLQITIMVIAVIGCALGIRLFLS